ncbi:HAD family hydrolase [Elusimicrobiota bacterium]
MSIKAIFFDMDGVLVDSRKTWHLVLNKALEELGYPVVSWEKFDKDFGQSVELDIKLYMNDKESFETVCKLYDKYYPQFVHELNPMDGIKELLGWLKEHGIKTACITNSPKSAAFQALNKCEIIDKLDLVVTSSEVQHGKPAPDMLLKAFEILRLKPEEVLFIGDSPFDFHAAKAAKVHFMAFGRELEGAEKVFNMFSDIKTWLSNTYNLKE